MDKQRYLMFLGAIAVVMAFLYGSVMEDSVMCYRVPGCPEIRHILYAH